MFAFGFAEPTCGFSQSQLKFKLIYGWKCVQIQGSECADGMYGNGNDNDGGGGDDDDDAFTLAFVYVTYTLGEFTAKPIIDHTIN